MSCYIASNDNRLYAGLETTFGQTPAITAANRFPAVRLSARQVTENVERRDKTGGRSFRGVPTGVRRQSSFELKTYLTSWNDSGEEPGYGPMFRAAMGAAPMIYPGGTIQSAESTSRISFNSAHALVAGQAVTVGSELRFVSAIVAAQTVDLNAPLSAPPTAGSFVGPTITYMLGRSLPSISLFDYWNPQDAIQRLLCGASVNEMRILVNGDFHEFEFKGPAKDVIDTESFTSGEGGLGEFPSEPAIEGFDYSIIPGHMGQVWLGSTVSRFYTLTSAEVKLGNNVETRTKEFGLEGLRCITAGERSVTADFELFADDAADTKALYEAARQRSPIRMMFQLGMQPAQLFGVYMKSVTPEVPEYDDSETRLSWRFSGCRAQGTADDELVIAFG